MTKVTVQLECDIEWVNYFLAIYEAFAIGSKLDSSTIAERVLPEAIDYLSFLIDGSELQPDTVEGEEIIRKFRAIGGRESRT